MLVILRGREDVLLIYSLILIVVSACQGSLAGERTCPALEKQLIEPGTDYCQKPPWAVSLRMVCSHSCADTLKIFQKETATWSLWQPQLQ